MARLPSRATLILNGAGVTVTEIAEMAGIAQPSVSAQLAGRRPLQDKTLDAIRRAAGRDVADDVQSVAATARSKYLLEVQAGRM
jgi:predicted transcriptional regulator